jgi:hypothetical protein
MTDWRNEKRVCHCGSERASATAHRFAEVASAWPSREAVTEAGDTRTTEPRSRNTPPQ